MVIVISLTDIIKSSRSSLPLVMSQNLKKNFTIWNILSPFYWLIRCFGLAPFSIVGDPRIGKIKTGLVDILFMLLWMAVQFYVVYVNITMDLSLSRTSSFLIDKGAHLIEIFNACNVLAGTCFYALCRKRIWRIFRTCHEFDEEVKNFLR